MTHRLMAAAILGLSALGAAAEPGYYVVTPYDNEGLRVVDFRYWTVKANGGKEYVWPEIGVGYGVNSRWTTELFFSWIGAAGMPTQGDTLNWQNEILLTQGEFPFDLAVHLQLIRGQTPEGGRGFEIGPVFQTDIGRSQLTANAIFERGYGGDLSSPTRLKYQWQWRYRWLKSLHVGMQGFGELGRWNDWDGGSQQSHRLGPAAFTWLRFSDREVVKLQAAWLVGKTEGRRGHMFTMRANYEF
jgi:hypothetical protein